MAQPSFPKMSLKNTIALPVTPAASPCVWKHNPARTPFHGQAARATQSAIAFS
jgi:hypothetical protein